MQYILWLVGGFIADIVARNINSVDFKDSFQNFYKTNYSPSSLYSAVWTLGGATKTATELHFVYLITQGMRTKAIFT
jgi:hypothetical protein